MTTKNKENNEMQVAQAVLDRITSSVNKLVDDVHVMKAELVNFKEAVSSDIQRLVELREKDVNEIRAQFAKK
jgi:hypothetical protein